MSDDQIQRRSLGDKIVYLLAQYKIFIGLGIGALIVLVIVDFIDFPEMPYWFWSVSQALAVGGIVGIILGKYVVDKYFPDNREPILEIGFNEETGAVHADVQLVDSPMWSSRQSGEHPALRPDTGNISGVVTGFEFNEEDRRLEVEGANPELSNPISLAARKGKFEAVRSELVSEAERADRIEQTLELRALEMQRANARALISAVETGSVVSPQAVSRAARGEMDEMRFRAEQRERVRDDRDGSGPKEQANGHREEEISNEQ